MIQVSGAEGYHCQPCPQSDHVLPAEAAGAGPEVCTTGPRAGFGEAPVRQCVSDQIRQHGFELDQQDGSARQMDAYLSCSRRGSVSEIPPSMSENSNICISTNIIPILTR